MPATLPVLLVAHQSPPLGGPGVRRVAAFVRHGSHVGLDLALLTAPAEDGARFHGYPIVPGSDDALLGRVVLRVATPRLGGVAGFTSRVLPTRVAWTLFHRRMREPEVPWRDPAVAAGLALAKNVGARVVVSSSQPYEAHAVGRRIARTLGVPWVADFRDPMSEAEGRWWPSRLHWRLEAREERRLLGHAALVWATSAAAADRWRARFPESAAKVRVRRNGVGDAATIATAPLAALPPLRIGHVGRLTDGATSASRLRRLDYRPGRDAGRGSSTRALVAGLARFLERTPSARGHLVLVTAGSAPDVPPPDGVLAEHHGSIPNADALRLGAGCHALYLPLTTPPPAGSLVVPQKAYEYGALGRPVLANGTRREATDFLGPLLLDAGVDDPMRMAAAIDDLWSGRVPLDARPRSVPRQADVVAQCAEDLRAVVAGTLPPDDQDRWSAFR